MTDLLRKVVKEKGCVERGWLRCAALGVEWWSGGVVEWWSRTK